MAGPQRPDRRFGAGPEYPHGDLRDFARRLAMLVAVVIGVLIAGTIGFTATAGISVWRAFQLTLDTVATVGSIPTPRDTGAEIVSVAVIVLGVGTLFYALVTVTEFFVAGHLGELLQERRMQRTIDSLTDHYLICGFGRVGRQVARDLRAAGARYVVIDDNPDNRDDLAGAVGVRFIDGSPSDDEVLQSAGIQRARGVLACVDSDAENIFITLTARELCPEIEIVARAAVEDSEKKLRRAGADRVISPYKASGSEMARLVLHPQISGVVEVAPEYRMEEIEVAAGCAGAGRTIEDVSDEAVIVGLRRPDGTFETQPKPATILAPGDVLVAMGTLPTMERLEALLEPAAQQSA